eukprot:CAMPEP_0185031872 /NCGR_PEP_ID=MMETSP1103-20130426/19561_1 /TAXON_ID=36769 /ORGANISM="Paraphysomonas bandaiensis, Strain Caron Lab Isolate" /LENGTH=246 /DNA_ID=CAMNT_0027567547 /DNA_START=887 /DNA_END=1624 /DNA_ORIENTATION=+
MEKAREVAMDNNFGKVLTVVANKQTKGRGTQGRGWMSPHGNLFMTIGFNLSTVPIPLTLTPLRIGCIIATAIERILQSEGSTSKIYLKWPNDVLIGDGKVSGVLIEIEGGVMLVGIGCNVAMAPAVAKEGPDNGRDSTCLTAHIPTSDAHNPMHWRDTLVRNIVALTQEWLDSSSDSAERVVQEFQQRMSFSVQKMRKDRLSAVSGDDSMSTMVDVLPLRLNLDGTLQVLHVASNTERTLAAEYLW